MLRCVIIFLFVMTSNTCYARTELLFSGDVTFARNIVQPIPELFGEKMWHRVHNAHAFVWNCEMSGPSEFSVGNTFVFKTDAQRLEIMKFKQSVAVLANNHIFDGGLEGLQSLGEILTSLGIPITGSDGYSRLLTEVHSSDGIISILGITPMVVHETLLPLKDAIEIIRHDKEKKHIVVIHDGEERSIEPTKRQKDYARMLADAGAVAVLFVHSHEHGNIERDAKTNAVIVWGLGNFIFGGNIGWKNRAAQILSLIIDENTVEAQWLHGEISDWKFELNP